MIKGQENIKPWKPGQSGNPKGRPKGKPNFATVFKRLLEVQTGKNHPQTNEPLDYMSASTFAIIAKACKGDTAAMKMIMDKVDGLSPTNLANYDVSGLSTEELSTLSTLLGKIKPKDE